MDPDPDPDPDLTIILLGNTGVGKSASGNTILGCKAFESRPSLKTVTTKICEATENVFMKRIRVIDTPGILECEHDIRTRCQSVLQSSGPCLFLVVLSINHRFTKEQEKALKATTLVLGDDGLEKSYMLFTSGDALRNNASVEDFIFEDEEGSLPDIVKGKFVGKFHLFNNVNGGQEQVRELLMKSGHLQTSEHSSHLPATCSQEFLRLKKMRIVLLGPPEGGKSSSGNTILGSELFRSDCDFDSVSTECVSGSADVEGRQVTVVDTPGFTDEVLTPQQLYTEIMKTVVEANPGPHAFVIVVKIGKIRRTDRELLTMLLQLFGSGAHNYTMVLFTHGDKLGGQSVDQLIQSNNCVSGLVSMCGWRYCVFDNKGRKSRQQVQNFMNRIDEMVTANGGEHYTSAMFRVAETFIREAEQTQLDQGAGTNEAPRETAQRRLQPFFTRCWSTVCCTFCCCCQDCRSSSGSDDERQRLLPNNQRSSIN